MSAANVKRAIARGRRHKRRNLAKSVTVHSETAPMVKARAQFRLRISRGEDIAVGPGKVDILEAIAKTGSITAAARQLGMSYRRAWLLVDTMNRCFKEPVVEAEAGGKRGGGTRLTPVGAEALQRYRTIEKLAARAAATELRKLQRLLR